MFQGRICVDLSHDHYFFSEKVTLDLSKTTPDNFLRGRTASRDAPEDDVVDRADSHLAFSSALSDFESGYDSR